MPSARALVLVVLAAFWPLLAGCASAPRPPMLQEVLGSWRIANVEVPAGAKIPTVTFVADGKVHGTAGINRYHTTIDIAAFDKGQWRPGPVMVTRMAGAPEAMQLETAFLGALETATDLMLVDGSLQLRNGAQTLLVLEPLQLR